MRVVFVHYRTGEKDGVSLEIEKRAEVFRKLGAEVYFISGFDGISRDNVFIIKEFDIKTNHNKFLREDSFYQGLFDEGLMIALYFQFENKIYKKLNKAFLQIKPDLVFVHNMFSHAYNLPATTALIKVLDKYQIKTVTVNHDFWFERDYFLKPKYFFIKEILDALPPARPYIIKHQVINGLAQKELSKRRNIKAERIGDYFEFLKRLAVADEFNSDLKAHFGLRDSDLVVLHATRITKRKNIENAFVFARELEKKLRSQAPVRILGRVFRKNSRVVVLLPNFVE
ncbi:MAG: glycosyltransferase family 4 protein, partial [bacterium]|nr:glycosyltransferase family 4 protein [bacterium]